MSNPIRQWQYESAGWKRVLDFIMQENVFSKNRLSEILKSSAGDAEMLNDAEMFLERFIQQETLVKLLRSDIQGFDQLLAKEIYDNQRATKDAFSQHLRLNNEIEKLRIAFTINKRQFDYFLQSNA